MTVETLLDRLEGVRRRPDGQYMARCPAHDDRSPSLSIREFEDGKVILRCFTGCTAYEVVTAAGLELRDLFPDRLPDQQRYRRQRHRLSARDVVDVLEHECLLVVMVANDMQHGLVPNAEDMGRLVLARNRIQRIKEATR